MISYGKRFLKALKIFFNLDCFQQTYAGDVVCVCCTLAVMQRDRVMLESFVMSWMQECTCSMWMML